MLLLLHFCDILFLTSKHMGESFLFLKQGTQSSSVGNIYMFC